MDGSSGGGEGGPGPDDIVRRARELSQQMSSEDVEGLRDMQKLISSMGLPAVKATFRAMLDASPLPPERLAGARARVEAIEAPPGCMEFSFVNRVTRLPDKVFLFLDACPRDHDTSAELDRLRSVVTDESWDTARKHISALVFYGRSTYTNASRLMQGLIREIFGLPADDPCVGLLDFQVDRASTTLFLREDWPSRVGLYVRRA